MPETRFDKGSVYDLYRLSLPINESLQLLVEHDCSP